MSYFASRTQAQTSTATIPVPIPAPSRPRATPRPSSSSVGTNGNGTYAQTLASAIARDSADGEHPLRQEWVFWFRQQRAPGNKIVNYEEGIKRVAAFDSVEAFWALWTHLNPPTKLQPTTDYLLFHAGVRRPVWEDPLNADGGKWIIRLRKGVADRLWEDLVMGIVGDQFDFGDAGDDADGASEICGCTISVRPAEDIISVWHRRTDPARVDRIRDTIRRVLSLPPNTVMDYKTNNDSMNDKSSFRNTSFDRTPLSGLQERH